MREPSKTDTADAHAFWEAAQRPDMKFVSLKTEEQQSVLALHRMREQMVKMRTMQINQLRGILYGFGASLPQGRRKGIAKIGEELAQLEDKLSTMVIETIRKQLHTDTSGSSSGVVLSLLFSARWSHSL